MDSLIRKGLSLPTLHNPVLMVLLNLANGMTWRLASASQADARKFRRAFNTKRHGEAMVLPAWEGGFYMLSADVLALARISLPWDTYDAAEDTEHTEITQPKLLSR